MERTPQPPPLWPRPPRQRGPSHPQPPQPPLPGRRPPRPCLPSPAWGPALPLSPRTPLQSQQRTRKRISPPGPPRPLRFLATTTPASPAPRRPFLSPSPWTDRAGRQEAPLARAQRVTRGRGGLGSLLWRRRLSVCPVFPAISPCQPSPAGNHGEADAALPRGARRGGAGAPLWDACSHPLSCPSFRPPPPPRPPPLTQSGFNKFMWVFNLNSAPLPAAPACQPLPAAPQSRSPGVSWGPLSWLPEGDLPGVGCRAVGMVTPGPCHLFPSHCPQGASEAGSASGKLLAVGQPPWCSPTRLVPTACVHSPGPRQARSAARRRPAVGDAGLRFPARSVTPGA